MQDLIDRITQTGCTTKEMMLGLPSAALSTSKATTLPVGETEFLIRIKVFKWRDVFQTMAIKLLQVNGESELVKDWKPSGEGKDSPPPRRIMDIVVGPHYQFLTPGSSLRPGIELLESFDRDGNWTPPVINGDLTARSEYEYLVGVAIVDALYKDDRG